jgi:Flp pilus assembly pilin Flp
VAASTSTNYALLAGLATVALVGLGGSAFVLARRQD